MNDEDLNFSNHTITTRDILGLLGQFEGDSSFEFWFDNVCRKDMDLESKKFLKRNFPRKNWLREVVMSLAWSIPVPKVEAASTLDGDDGDSAFPDEADGKNADGTTSTPIQDKVNAKIKALLEREYWEGKKAFEPAILWWRCWAFTAGDLFVKLPCEPVRDDDPDKTDSGLLCYPERMPAQRTYIKMNTRIRKIIDGFRFQYNLGLGTYTEQGDQAQLVTEYISKDEWTLDAPGQTQQSFDTQGILAVAHLPWEEREDGPRGIPLAMRLLEVVLSIQSVEMDRRLGNMMGSVPMYKIKNAASADVPTIAPGAVWSVKTEVPWAPADVEAMASHFDDQSLQRELKDHKRELYHLAFLPFEEDKEDGQLGSKSGKALQMLSKNQIKYREMYQLSEAAFIRDLVYKALFYEGEATIKPADVVVTYDPLVMPDPTEQLAKAEFYWNGGLECEALVILGEQEDDAEQMLSDRDEKRQADMLTAGAMAAAMPTAKPMVPNGKVQAQNPPVPQGNAPVPTPAGDK